MIQTRRTGADLVTFFAAFDMGVARWITAQPPPERARVVRRLDSALAAASDEEAFNQRVEALVDDYKAADPGSQEKQSLANTLRILEFESERLYGTTSR